MLKTQETTHRQTAVSLNTLRKKECLLVVVPVFNERQTIDAILARILAQTCVAEVVVVDDASIDGTWERLCEQFSSNKRVSLLRHAKNRGKGAAVRTGLACVRPPYVIIQDADLEYNPADYARMLEKMQNGEADVVYGSRFTAGLRTNNPKWHTAGNWLLTWLVNLATGLRLSDSATCYKMFRREIIGQIELHEDRFGFCPEVTAKIARLKARVVEVPISYKGRTRAEGKKIGLWDGLDALRCIVKYRWFK